MKTSSRLPVYTLTPNPALDLSGHVASIRANEKNYVHDVRRDPGGNGINAARIATRLGANAIALGFMGGGTGSEINNLLNLEGVKTDFITIHSNTRINVTVTNEADHKQTRLTFPGPKVSFQEEKQLLVKIGKLSAPGILVLGGSLPSGLRAGFYRRVFSKAEAHGLGVALDAPANTLHQLRLPKGKRFLFIKPNEVELSDYVGRPLRTEKAILAAGHELLNLAALVCISLGDKGAYFITRHNVWRGHAPHVKARGTVGAGDSMVGALSAQLSHAGLCTAEDIENIENIFDLEKAFCWGLAAGAATATSLGTSLAPAALIRKLVPKARITKLL